MNHPPEPIAFSRGEKVSSDFASFLGHQREPIIRLWIDTVRRDALAGASHALDDRELADHLPQLFDDLVDILEGEAPPGSARSNAEKHGAHRWRQQYSLEEVLREIAILRNLLLTSVLDAWTDEQPDLPPAQSRRVRQQILDFMDEARGGSARQYMQRSQERLNALRESDRELSEQRQLALDSAQVGFWHFDLASERIHWDERFKAIFGITDGELSYERILAVLHPDDRESVRAAIDASSRPVNPVPYAIEYRVILGDGSVRWIQAQGNTHFAGEGAARHAVSLVGTVRDVTDAKNAQEAIYRSKRKYYQLFDSVDSAFCVIEMIWDETGRAVDYRFLEVNRHFQDHNGLPHAAGRTARELIPGLEDRWFEIFGRVSLTGEPIRFTEGSAVMGRWWDLYAFPIGLETSAPRQVAVLFNDITQRRRAEEELRAAKAEAETASRAKDEFLATLSHELRTPLNAILGWTQVLRGDPANSPEVEDGLATIERNARAQNQIIEDLLDMSRIISGKVRLEMETVDLADTVRGALETLRPAAEAKGVRLLGIIDPGARAIRGDANRLQQVFWNLLTNAVKFTPKGGRVQVTLERVHSYLEVRVSDTGEGIAPEFLPYVFDRFRQQDASTTRRHGGLGLGLAIVRQLVELHGGKVRAASEGPGRGTTFVVELPVAAVYVPEDAGEADSNGSSVPGADQTAADFRSGASKLGASAINLSGIKVVVVDDEADARALIKRLLTDRGAEVRAAGSAAEALALLREERPDVLVSDIGMPGEDGFALIRQVRALPPAQGGNTPALALTAYARSEDRLKVILAGFQMHLAKPVEILELLVLVANLAARTEKRV